MPPGFRYNAATANHGLLGAYEAALEQARAEGYDWLLTLDQDTALPENFFSAIEPGLRAAAEDPRIAAIVPHLAEGEQLLSPAYVGLTRTTPMPASFSGVPAREARAFNSAALLRVEALEAIGGFDPCFWLDHLDSWLHHQLYIHGWRMYVLDSVHLEHHFSLLNYKERVTLAHFRNFLGAESAYFDLYGSWLARLAYSAQLAVRLVNQRRRGEAPEIRSGDAESVVAPAECHEKTADRCLARQHGRMARRDAGSEGLMPDPSMRRPDAAPLRVLAVMVLYRMQPAQSKTLAGLAQAFAADAALATQIEVLVWDNSPTAADESSLPFACTYRHAPVNAGVSGAYNAAAAMAAEHDRAWLLLLDQDTSVTGEFLRGMLRACGAGRQRRAGGRHCSVSLCGKLLPVAATVAFRASRRRCPVRRAAARSGREMFAANSGTLMRVRALAGHRRIQQPLLAGLFRYRCLSPAACAGFAVRIAGDLALEHEVALLDYDARMTPARYATYLAAEGDFLDLYRGRAERLLHLLRLAVRVVRQRRFADKTFSRMTRQELWRRLRVRRRARLRARD